MVKIINVTDITEYLYCPRKVYLRLVEGIRSPPNKKMIFGMLRHKVFDIFNKNEQVLVSGIKTKLEDKEITALYKNLLTEIARETFLLSRSLAEKFDITSDELLSSVEKTMNPEIELRIKSIKEALALGFLGKELWRNLKPKYLTEFKVESYDIGLRGRVDRVKFSENIEPYEIKTRDKIYDSDKIQLAAYAILLEDRFKREINKGIIEFSGKQEEILLDKELKSEVLRLADEIRNLTEGKMPSSFSKCKECQFREHCG